MPVAGPRTQTGPVPGYRNPPVDVRAGGTQGGYGRYMLGAGGRQTSTRINLWGRPGPVAQLGRTPLLQMFSLRGEVLAAGFVRKMWRQSVNLISAQSPYSWTRITPVPGRGASESGPIGLTRALRYQCSHGVYMGSGLDNTAYAALHTTSQLQARAKPITQGSGARGRPTVRNRMTSFGSRVPPLNEAVPGAQQIGSTN